MRMARIVGDGAANYHVISRVVGREFVLGAEAEAERMRDDVQTSGQHALFPL